MLANYDIRKIARDTLSGNWTNAVLLYLVHGLILSAAGSASAIFLVFAGVVTTFITAAITLSQIIYSKELLLDGTADFEQGFKGFNYILKAFGITFMTGLFIFLWSLLLIIPGIIKAFSYSQALYILSDEPEIGVMDAIKKSQKMMEGHKGQLFVLGLSFIGWGILTIFTFGIGTLWLQPYMQVSFTRFYFCVKDIYYNGSGTTKTYTEQPHHEKQYDLAEY